MARIIRRLGLPFRGFNAASRRWQAPPDVMTGSSYDWLIDPSEGKLIRRGGSFLLGQFIKDANEVTLQLESGPTYNDLYARQVLELNSGAISDGLPTHCVLYEGPSAGLLVWMSPNTYTVANCSMVINTATLTTSTANGFEDVTLGVRIQITGLSGTVQVTAINSTTSIVLSMEADATITNQTATIGGPLHGLNLNIGRRFGSTHYPSNFKMVPVIGVSNRCKAAAERAKIALGSRRAVSAGDWLYLGNGSSGNLPLRWNRDWNDQLSSGSRNERVFPMGHIPPLWMNVVNGSSLILGPNANWLTGKSYFFSMIFRYKDGSWSKPIVPQFISASSAYFYGYFVTTADVDTLTITMPIGPSDVTARAILRTRAGTLTVPPALLDEQGNSLLGIAALIENNTETSYTLREGNDNNLVFDPTIVRFDHVWPPPTRYLWSGDQRLWGIGLQPNPAAIILAPKYNANDESLSSTVDEVEVTGSGITIRFNADGTTTTALAGNTLAELARLINEEFGAGATTRWVAQLAPGADPGASADNLAITTANDFGDSASARLRSFGNAWPAVLLMDSTYLAAQSARQGHLWFSMGGPGGPQGPSPAMSIKNFRAGREGWGFGVGGASLIDGQVVCFSRAIATCRNIRDSKTGLDDDYRLEPLNESRGCISDASIVSGDGWVGYMTRDGYVVTDGSREVVISGELYNPASGQGILTDPIRNCISALGTNQGEACARYVTAWVEGTRLFLGLSLAATAPSTADDPVFIYDFSAGAPASGLAEVLRADGTPWGWSAALGYAPRFPGVRAALNGGSIGRLQDSGAGRRIVVASSYLSSTAPTTPHGVIGRILEPNGVDLLQLDLDGTTHAATATSGSANLTAVAGDLTRIAVGATVIEITGSNVRKGSTVASVSGTTVVMDRTAKATGASTVIFHGKDIEPAAYLATDMVGTMKMKSLQGLWVLYNQAGTGMEIQITNELDRTGVVTYALPAATAADGFSRQKLNPTQALRGLSKAYEVLVVDRGTTTQQSEFWGLEAEVDLLDSHR